jgi:hypothetical protein
MVRRREDPRRGGRWEPDPGSDPQPRPNQRDDENVTSKRKLIGGYRFGTLLSASLGNQELRQLANFLKSIEGNEKFKGLVKGKAINMPDLRRIYRSGLLGNEGMAAIQKALVTASAAAPDVPGAATSPQLSKWVQGVLGEERSSAITTALEAIPSDVLAQYFKGPGVNLGDLERLTRAVIASGAWKDFSPEVQRLISGAIVDLRDAAGRPANQPPGGKRTTSTPPPPTSSDDSPPPVSSDTPPPTPPGGGGGGGGGGTQAQYAFPDQYSKASEDFVLRGGRPFGMFGASAPSYADYLAQQAGEGNTLQAALENQVAATNQDPRPVQTQAAPAQPRTASAAPAPQQAQAPQEQRNLSPSGLGALFIPLNQATAASFQATGAPAAMQYPQPPSQFQAAAPSWTQFRSRMAGAAPGRYGSTFMPIGYGL